LRPGSYIAGEFSPERVEIQVQESWEAAVAGGGGGCCLLLRLAHRRPGGVAQLRVQPLHEKVKGLKEDDGAGGSVGIQSAVLVTKQQLHMSEDDAMASSHGGCVNRRGELSWLAQTLS